MRRLYTFGCSFTQYKWPTWADILGKEYDYFENWARCGGGNQFIFNSVTECLVKNNLTKDDIVIIMWTNVTREDRYVTSKGGWITPGSIFTQSVYSADYVKEWADVKGYYIRDLAAIHATKRMLDSYGINYIFLSMVPVTCSDQYLLDDVSDNLTEQFRYYQESLSIIKPSVFETIFNFNWASRPWPSDKITDLEKNYSNVAGTDWPMFKVFFDNFYNKKFKIKDVYDSKWGWDIKILNAKRKDIHPTPIEHLEYLDIILPELNVSFETRKWVRDINSQVISNVAYNHLWCEYENLPSRW